MGVKSSVLFEEGDHVVVVGTTLTNDGPATKNMTIASVIGVGSQELFLKCSKSQRIFKRPKLNCYRIPRQLDVLSPLAVRKPVLGDFVMSYSGGRFTQDKKVIGILDQETIILIL